MILIPRGQNVEFQFNPAIRKHRKIKSILKKREESTELL